MMSIKPEVKAPDTYSDLVSLGNTLRDTHNETNLALNSFNDSISSKRWGDIDNGRVRFHFLHSLRNSKSVM